MVLKPTVRFPAGNIIATGVSEDEYMERYAADFCEWVDGMVVQLSPVTRKHDDKTRYLAILFAAYFELRPIGDLLQSPFVMRSPITKRRREPDLQVILHGNAGELTNTVFHGAPDIVVEVVSPESTDCDYEEKFLEYERAGVGEYWLLDPLLEAIFFYVLKDGEPPHFVEQFPDEDSYYRTPRLPGLALHVPTLWRVPLPGPGAVGRAVEDMLVMSNQITC